MGETEMGLGLLLAAAVILIRDPNRVETKGCELESKEPNSCIKGLTKPAHR
jgi:hypothetical protein